MSESTKKFEEVENTINSQIQDLQKVLKRLKDRKRKEVRNWSLVGDMIYISEILSELLESYKGER